MCHTWYSLFTAVNSESSSSVRNIPHEQKSLEIKYIRKWQLRDLGNLLIINDYKKLLERNKIWYMYLSVKRQHSVYFLDFTFQWTLSIFTHEGRRIYTHTCPCTQTINTHCIIHTINFHAIYNLNKWNSHMEEVADWTTHEIHLVNLENLNNIDDGSGHLG